MILSNFLRGEKVYLSALSKDDAAIVARFQNNSEYLRLGDTEAARPFSVEAVADYIDDRNKRKNLFTFGIRLVKTDQLIGDEAIGHIEWPHAVGELEIAIGDPATWGKGFGGEAMALLLRFGVWEINLHRVQLTVFEYNVRAIAAYEKLGIVREGNFRQYLQRDGRRYDMLLYGLLRPEWEARNGSSAETAGQ
jgi:RimJ/RimL family protein N-acetyltransferase